MAEFEFAGTTFRGGKMFAILTALSTLGGGAWAGFEFYKDYMDMKEIIQEIDIDAISAQNELVIQKADEQMVRIDAAIDYTRDIKQGLKDDILKLEANIDRMEDKVDESERRVKDTATSIETTLAGVRNDLNQQQKDVTSSIREVEATIRLSEKDVRNVMKDTVKDLEFKMDKLDNNLKETIQEALDNPLAGN
jgi:DNA repair exonuclease SbcCD ATPase subunit